ncbi:MAG: PLP-dependent aminotransferase family protein [Caldilineaceae bacterium]|nr:PLP-dependent aminotransferase family protein [Caldilineaceae bacterium]
MRVSQANPAPDLIDFGIGQPGFDLLPAELLRQAGQARLDGKDTSFLNYGLEQGDEFLRHALARFLSEQYASPVDPAHLFISAGASSALALICMLYTKPGDVVLVEEPSYFLALRIFADYGLRVISLPVDDAGLDPDAVETILSQYRPTLLYTIPTFQNPTGVTLSPTRRARLAELARQHDFLIVADEVYHSLSYASSPPRPMAAYAGEGHVLSIGSFSKILAPGLRLGWIQAAPEQIARVTNCGLVDSGGGMNPLAAALVRPLLENGGQNEYLTELRTTYAARVNALNAALARELGDRARWRRPEGGFFFWLELLPEYDTDALLDKARLQRVSFQPGPKFSSRNGLHHCLRLSFAFYAIPQLEEGARRLAKAVR